MRVIFHQSALAGRKTGVGYYTSRLLEALRDQPEDLDLDGFPTGWLWHACHARTVLTMLRDRLKKRSRELGWLRWLGPVNWATRAAYAGLYRYGRGLVERQFRAIVSGGGYDLYHEPNFIPMPTDLPTVVTVHDLSVLLHPEWHPALRVQSFERGFHRGLRQCQHVITGSETVRRQVIRSLNIPPARVSRVSYGVHPHLEPLPSEYTIQVLHRLGLRPGYLLYLGTIEPRKNILVLLRAYCALPQAVRDRCPLLLVGNWGWKSEAVRAFYQSEARHRGVQYLGYIPDRHLPVLYNGARALVYPSLYEGFGLPCMEMMACGGAVLASTADVFRETIGGQACLIPPEDTDAWRAAMARVIDDEDWHLSLCQGATRLARSYTWEKAAAKTLEVYRRVCGVRSSPRLERRAA
jgi:alpha-1,3-rhamnosyl/mannosyltransferase